MKRFRVIHVSIKCHKTVGFEIWTHQRRSLMLNAQNIKMRGIIQKKF